MAEDNPEVMAARAARIPVGAACRDAGRTDAFPLRHRRGRNPRQTTTTSLITSLLAEGGLDPTFVIGDD